MNSYTTKIIQWPLGRQCQNNDCRLTMPAGYKATQINDECGVFCSMDCAEWDYDRQAMNAIEDQLLDHER